MNLRRKMHSDQQTLTHGLRGKFRRQRRMHDPLLVFNMSIFNFTDGWNRTFNPLKAHENGTR
jgi:hypothetical protein